MGNKLISTLSCKGVSFKYRGLAFLIYSRTHSSVEKCMYLISLTRINYPVMRSKAVTFSNFLRQPYPYYYDQQNLGKLSLGIFFLAFFFVYLFEPFNVNPEEHRINYFWISLLHVIVSCLVFFIYFTLVNLLKPEEEKWTVGKEILTLLLVLLFIGIANFLLRDLLYNNPNNWSFIYLLEEVRNTILVGVLIIIILVPLNFARVYSRNTRKVESLRSASNVEHSQINTQVVIESQLKTDDFTIELEKFLFAKAEGNYVEFHLIDGENKKLLKRITIKDLERQLIQFPWILKTHRSYLVNLRHVTAVTGNAQGYQLSLRKHPTVVPVSRGLLKKFDEAFTALAL